MADVTLTIGDRRHIVTCRDGEEDELRRLGTMLDSRWTAAQHASGGLNAERSMLFVALLLADSLNDMERRPAGRDNTALLERLAERLEGIATALEE